MFVYFTKDTFARAQRWVKELRQLANPNVLIALAGNKADMAAEARDVTVEVRLKSDIC